MIPRIVLEPIVERALQEDLSGGDLTTAATVNENARCTARALAKQTLVTCGGDVFRTVFHKVDPALQVEASLPDGQQAPAGSTLWTVKGSTRSVLMAERVALNFVQRLCGIATLTRQFVAALPAGSTTRITDTRKTTPGLRALERYAVRCGGGHNHRDNLGAALLIKDNHIAAAGGVRAAIEQARANTPHSSKLEIEVTNLAQLDEALAAGAEIVLLDNFADAEVGPAVQRIAGRALVEVSGGITLARIPTLAKLGVDVISVGALTHSAPSADISLELTPER
jgi:nicotinate-nucleotide pyrophosphorylase (carboxylating)